MDTATITGSIGDPDFRRRRAEHAARARTTVEHYIDKLVDEAPPLTDDQRHKLAQLLAPAGRDSIGGGLT